MDVGQVLPEIALLVTAVAALLLASFLPQRRQQAVAWLVLAGLASAAVLCWAQLGRAPALAFYGSWTIDAASIWGRLLILAAAGLVVLSAPDWLREDRRHGEFYVLLLLSTLGAMVLTAASDLLLLTVGLLLSSITGYVLAAFHRDWALSVEAGMKYFLLGAFANALLMVGVVLLFGVLGDSNYQALAQTATAPPTALAQLALALVLVGIGFKLGAVPAHAWMPDVAQGAPAPAAAFLTVVPKIGALLALARLLPLFPEEYRWRLLVAAMAVATMTVGNLAALWQTDLRRLLGWSSVSQSGYALMAICVLGRTAQALPALLLFLAAYAAANLAAFAAVTELRGRTALDDYRGLAWQRSAIAAVLTVALLSLLGLPPLAGFAGKLALFTATLDAGYAWLAAVALVNTVVSLFYYLRVLSPLYFGQAVAPVAVLGRWSALATLVAGASVIALGVGANGLLAALARAAQ
jgi:NADH-quinone oxidoreductase subunit N